MLTQSYGYLSPARYARDAKPFRLHAIKLGEPFLLYGEPAYAVTVPCDDPMNESGHHKILVWVGRGTQQRKMWLHPNAEVCAPTPEAARRWKRRKNSTVPLRKWDILSRGCPLLNEGLRELARARALARGIALL